MSILFTNHLYLEDGGCYICILIKMTRHWPGYKTSCKNYNNLCLFCYSPTPYEFTQAWTSMKHIHDTESYAQLIRQIPPNNLAAGIC